MMNIKKRFGGSGIRFGILLTLALMFSFFVWQPKAILAQDGSGADLSLDEDTCAVTDTTGKPWDSFQKKLACKAGFTDQPNLHPRSIGQLIFIISQGVLSVLGVIFLIMVVYSGIRWMVAGGRAEVIENSQNTIKNAVIGLALVLGAYAITNFVLKGIIGG